jgi:membrane-associated phospholipid phosphatase
MRTLHYAACLVVSLALAAPAFAQDPLPVDTARADATPDSTTPGDQLTGQVPRPGMPLPTDIITTPAGSPESDSFLNLVAGDFRRFFSGDTARVMGFASVSAIAAAPWDREGVNNGFGIPTSVFQSGNVVGSFVFQVGLGAASYGIGAATGNGKLALMGRDVVRAQIVSQVFTQAVKFTIQRERPDGSNHQSFPSGHASSAFATAGVLQRHYGWKAGVPAYAVGAYVALARMSWNKHHASDVVMGAGLGIASARTVTMRVGGSKFNMGVQPQAGGASVNFTKIYP